MPQIAKLIGGAGTGKTRALLELMDRAVEQLGDPRRVGFVSFTRAARHEAALRAAEQFDIAPQELEQTGWFRTLHSVAYQCLGLKKGDLIVDDREGREWISNMLQEDLQRVPNGDEDYAEPFRFHASDAEKALALWHVARHRICALEDTWRLANATDPNMPKFDYCADIVEKYEVAKSQTGRLDFTDSVQRFADGDGDVPPLPCWIHDEMQDSTPLLDKAFQRLISHPVCKWVYLAGDPFQCQPAGTMIRTKVGNKPIEKLNPKRDWIIAFNRDGRFYGTGRQIAFRLAHRTVDSSHIWEIALENGQTLQATSNHKWYCRFTKPHCYAVYLMQKQERWRVGTVQMFAQGKLAGESRLGMRSQQEKAERTWILKTFSSDRKARAYEQVVSCRYGIPQITFRPPWGKTNLTQDFIDYVFNTLGCLDVNAGKCLFDHNREISFPYYVPRCGRRRGIFYGSKIETCNLIPGIAMLPRYIRPPNRRSDRKNGVYRTGELRRRRQVAGSIEWVHIKSIHRLPSGIPTRVYSLDVNRHHTYIADGYVTCNSIYQWAGADHRVFLDTPADKTRTMPKSWRCPANILELGEEILKNCSDYFDRHIEPAGHEGMIEKRDFNNGLASEINPRESWLLLARTNHLAKRWQHKLSELGVPWLATRGGSPWRAPKRNVVLRALYRLEHGEMIDGSEWKKIVESIDVLDKQDGTRYFEHGNKATWSRMKNGELKREFPAFRLADFPGLMELGGTNALIDAIRSGKWKRLVAHGHNWAEAVDEWGMDAVLNPRVRVGTIHSAKGQEADNVAVIQSVTQQVHRSSRTVEGADEESRVWYVACTRARKRLIIARERGANFVKRLPV